MIKLSTAEMLLGNGQLAVTLVRPNGDILYENRLAREMMGHEAGAPKSLLASLSASTSWEEIMLKVSQQGTVEDEPVLLQTVHGDADLCYLTAHQQFDENGEVESVVCVWAARRKAVGLPTQSDTGTLSEYTRDLEELIEHRTYQQLLAAEQSEFAREALDVLPVGIIVAASNGDLVYRNRAMTDEFGLRMSDYLKANVHYMLSPELVQAFDHVVESGLRAFYARQDLGGQDAAVDILPLIRAAKVQKVVIQYRRRTQGASDS
jgi:transcriptional regulator with PAS, ATPase and Fis domain